MVYVLCTAVVLLLLNVYCSHISQRIFYQSKQTSMMEMVQLAAQSVSEIEVLNPNTAASAVTQLEGLTVTRLIVTDASGTVVYDSLAEKSTQGDYALYPEIILALEGNDVFTWQYHRGEMESRAAAPVLSYNTLMGCVYILEYDPEQGELIASLQQNILLITIGLEVVIILFALVTSSAFSKRMRAILASIRIIRTGDYSHKVNLRGRDELSVLGDEFNDLTDKLMESEQRRRQFVSDASHELKTPLASIKLLSDSILQNDMDADTMREFVGDIGNEADRLNRMSQKLLSLTKLDTEIQGENEIVYVGPTIQRVVRMLSAVAEKAQVQLHVDIVQDGQILILEDDLYQIIFNLVENGIKYNVPGGQVSVLLTRTEDDMFLQIRDSGVGIPEESLELVFERFYRVDKARSRETGGSGLGLSIVHDMVTRNRGHIQVSSVEGQGTIFSVDFPAFDMEDEQ